MMAPVRQERPLHHLEMVHSTSAACPFCCPPLAPYDVRIYPNDFPSLSPSGDSRVASRDKARLFKRAPAYGYCDVVLYSPAHDLTFAELPLTQIEKVVGLWQARFAQLTTDRRIRYVQIFENKGATIGVTIPHPHGQIYAFPYIPPRIQRKAESAAAYYKEKGRDLWGDTLKAELKARKRIVAQGECFVAYVPFAAHWPYEVHVVPLRHMSYLSHMSYSEVSEFAAILKTIAMKYDHLFGFSFPYMMTLFNAPVNLAPGQEGVAASGSLGKTRDRPRNDKKGAWRFHVEFYPPFRAADKLKFRASVESAAGSFINDAIPEDTAAELRTAKPTLKQVLAGAKHRHFPPPPPLFSP